MINLLIKEIIVFDDKVEIYYKHTNRLTPGDNDHPVSLFHLDKYSKFHENFKFDFRKTQTENLPIVVNLDVFLYI